MESSGTAGKKSLFRRLLTTETLICCVGIACVVFGVANGIRVMPLFFGLCIVAGSVVLHFVRKKDWDAHWADQDRIRREYDRRIAEAREKKQ